MSGSLIRPVALLVAGLTLGLVAGVYVATLSLEEDARPAPSVAAGTEVADGADVGVPVTAAPAASLDRHDHRLDLYRRAAAADGEELLSDPSTAASRWRSTLVR